MKKNHFRFCTDALTRKYFHNNYQTRKYRKKMYKITLEYLSGKKKKLKCAMLVLNIIESHYSYLL